MKFPQHFILLTIEVADGQVLLKTVERISSRVPKISCKVV